MTEFLMGGSIRRVVGEEGKRRIFGQSNLLKLNLRIGEYVSET